MDELVRLQALDGYWEVGGADRRRGVWPEGMNCVWDRWGALSARFSLRREPGAQYPDLSGFTPIEIEKGGGAWEGFVDSAPEGDDFGLSVEAVGWPDHGNDDPYRKIYVHQRLTEWRDWRSNLAADLARFKTGWNVEVGDGGIVITTTAPADGSFPRGGAYLDLGPGSGAKRVAVEWEKNQWAGTATAYLAWADEPEGLDATSTSVASVSDATTSGTTPITLPAASRFLRVWVDTDAAQATDRFFRVKSIRVFAEAAYESGNASVLKASDVLKDGLRHCPLWSQDQSGVDATLFNLTELAATEPRTFREWAEGVNALHGYALKLERGRRLRFKSLPSKPLLTAPEGPGVAFRNLSKGSARDSYNRVLAFGVDGLGTPVAVERWAAQQPGVPTEPVSSPAPTNPSFATDASGWSASSGTIARTTAAGEFDSAPAGGKWSGAAAGDHAILTTFAGTFERGVMYLLSFRAKVSVVGGAWTANFGLLGTDASIDSAQVTAGLTTAFTTFTVGWLPKEDSTGVTFLLSTTKPLNQTLYIDTLTMAVAKPTLVDRRGFVRTKLLSTNQSLDAATLAQFSDAWLQAHMRSQFRGDLAVVGRGVKRHLSGEGVDPFALGEMTMELVHLPGEIDPDTGALGRDGRIVSVTYDGENEAAQVGVDSTTDSFEQLMARFNLLAGQGG